MKTKINLWSFILVRFIRLFSLLARFVWSWLTYRCLNRPQNRISFLFHRLCHHSIHICMYVCVCVSICKVSFLVCFHLKADENVEKKALNFFISIIDKAFLHGDANAPKNLRFCTVYDCFHFFFLVETIYHN